MTSSEVLERILREIDGNWSISNHHGVDLKESLLPTPVKTAFQDLSGPHADPSKVVDLWLVLEEIPNDGSGYKIVFDEERGKFGLATSDANNRLPAYLGPYGSFLDALASM